MKESQRENMTYILIDKENYKILKDVSASEINLLEPVVKCEAQSTVVKYEEIKIKDYH